MPSGNRLIKYLLLPMTHREKSLAIAREYDTILDDAIVALRKEQANSQLASDLDQIKTLINQDLTKAADVEYDLTLQTRAIGYISRRTNLPVTLKEVVSVIEADMLETALAQQH